MRKRRKRTPPEIMDPIWLGGKRYVFGKSSTQLMQVTVGYSLWQLRRDKISKISLYPHNRESSQVFNLRRVWRAWQRQRFRRFLWRLWKQWKQSHR